MYELKQQIKSLVQKYGKDSEAILPILQNIVRVNGFLSQEAMVEVARELDMSAAQVFGTASFYSFLTTKPLGKYVIRLCKTITCSMHGKGQVLKALEEVLKVKLGETTHDRKFTLLETNCLGQCHKGPAMLINNKPYTELTPEKVRIIIENYRNQEVEMEEEAVH